MLTPDEGAEYSRCQPYIPSSPGNLVNSTTEWNITGSLIQKITMAEADITCSSRTLLIPVRYRTAQDAMDICQQIGETGRTSYSFYSPIGSL